MGDLIDRQLVLDRINKQREHLRPYLYPQDKIGDSAYRICAEFVERLPSAKSVKAYTKADYIMALHKEYGCSLTKAEKAHDKALEYLQSKAMMKG